MGGGFMEGLVCTLITILRAYGYRWQLCSRWGFSSLLTRIPSMPPPPYSVTKGNPVTIGSSTDVESHPIAPWREASWYCSPPYGSRHHIVIILVLINRRKKHKEKASWLRASSLFTFSSICSRSAHYVETYKWVVIQFSFRRVSIKRDTSLPLIWQIRCHHLSRRTSH